MSDIKVGDLVMMVRGHECHLRHLAGIPMVVEGFAFPRGGGWRCSVCWQESAGPNEMGAVLSATCGHGPLPLSWLRKIDPPAETTEREKEMAI
jgi:hypothetical protein